MESVTYNYGNCIVKINIPELTDNEKKKSKKRLYDATRDFLISIEREKQLQE